MLQGERQKHRTDEEVVKELVSGTNGRCGSQHFSHTRCRHQQCLANGASYEKATQEGSSLDSLEMFFTGFPRMLGLALFPALRQLTILGQDVEHIEGLQGCPLLQELWVAECHLTVSRLGPCAAFAVR